jgi:hypothetical protein
MTRLQGLGYAESQAIDLKNAPANEYNNTFIIKVLSGAMTDESETLIDRFYDIQDWQIQIAFERSEQNDIINRDDAQRKKDAILKDLDNPAHWEGFARILKYKGWKVEELPNYFLLTINLKIVDTIIY